MAHLNPLLEALTERDLRPYTRLIPRAILELNRLLQILTIKNADSLDINALENILINFTNSQPSIKDLVTLLETLSTIFNRIKSPIKLELATFIDVLAAVDTQEELDDTSIELAKIIKTALFSVGAIMRNRLYLYAEIEGSALFLHVDNLLKRLLPIRQAHPARRQLEKYIAACLYALIMMGKSTVTDSDTSWKLAEHVLARFDKSATKHSEKTSHSIANQLILYLSMACIARTEVVANEPKPKWPTLEEIFAAQRPKPNQLQIDLREKLLAEGIFSEVVLEGSISNTYADLVCKTEDGIGIIIEIIGTLYHYDTRVKTKKDAIRTAMIKFLHAADEVINIEVGPGKKFDIDTEIRRIRACVKALRLNKKDVKGEPPAARMEFYQFIVKHLKLTPAKKSAETLPPEPIGTTTPPALESPPELKQEISLLSPDSEVTPPLPEKKENKSSITVTRQNKPKHVTDQLIDAAKSGNVKLVRKLLPDNSSSLTNPFTRRQDPYPVVVALMVAIQTESRSKTTIPELKDVITHLVTVVARDALIQEKYDLSPWIVACQGGEKSQWVLDLMREKLIPTQSPDKNISKNSKKNKNHRKYKKEKQKKQEEKALHRAHMVQALKDATAQAEKIPENMLTKVKIRRLLRDETFSQTVQAFPSGPKISITPIQSGTPLDQKSNTTTSTLPLDIKQDDKIILPPSSKPLRLSTIIEKWKKDNPSNVGSMLSEYLTSILPFIESNSFATLSQLAGEGNPTALFYMGLCYWDDSDNKTSVLCFEIAAREGLMQANYMLGLIYEHHATPDLPKMAMYYQRAAQGGLVYAQAMLAQCYIKGTGVAKDTRLAVEWYQKAAAQGHAIAQYHLSIFYKNGLGIAADMTWANYWLEQAARQGHADAQCELAHRHHEGLHGFLIDKKKSIRLYQAAAEQDLAKAQLELALHYFNGDGVTKDMKQAFKWCQQAADHGLARAEALLGALYNIDKNLKAAFEWYQKAAKQGDAAAQYALGLYYENGISGIVTKNINTAIHWYTLSAKQKLDPAQDALFRRADDYFRGYNGLPEDRTQTAKLFEILAQQNHSDAQFRLGNCYLHGWGKLQDKQKAAYWWQQAANQGHANAQHNLGYYYQESENIPAAITWYQKAAAQNFVLATTALALLEKADGANTASSTPESGGSKPPTYGLR